MQRKYMGSLSKEDPLFSFLLHDIMPQFTQRQRGVNFRVYRMHSSNNDVYMYEESESRVRVVGKFFRGSGEKKQEDAARRAQQEFLNLKLLRSYGLQKYPHHVIKPLAYNLSLNNVLVEEYCVGNSLGHFINNAVYHHKHRTLYRKLTSLAFFLATMHNSTAREAKVDFQTDCNYFKHLVGQAKKKHLINENLEGHFHHLCHRWKEHPKMWQDQQVLAHGDATPSNFIFGNGLNVTAIDLERMRYTDRVCDLGRIVGELQHFFLEGTGNKGNAEPFIGHFLWEYAGHFPDRISAFQAITARLPFQIGVTLLRIARNAWINRDHAHKLVHAAQATLESL